MYGIKLLRCTRANPIYQEFRDRHYVPNNGAVGQQIHYLIMVDGEWVGIISGGSAAYAVRCRDEYFGINKENRATALNGIVDNTVFRLEKNVPNLGTQILSMWRKKIQVDWERTYGVKVAGFETFVIENDRRKGSMYKADNWTFVGETQGGTKFHQHGVEKSFERGNVAKKLVFCKWIKGGRLPLYYESSWSLNGQCRGQMTINEYMEANAD